MARKKAPIGERIKALREEKGMDLDQMANETGASISRLKDIEAGKVMPPVGTLLSIARALEVDSQVFLEDKAPRSTKKQRAAAYSKRTQNYAYTTLAPGGHHKHMKAFKVAIEANADHEGVGYQHEGEEFVYVLAGTIEITVGDHTNTLNPGESLHFNSGIPHHMKNTADTDAEMIVVVYTP